MKTYQDIKQRISTSYKVGMSSLDLSRVYLTIDNTIEKAAKAKDITTIERNKLTNLNVLVSCKLIDEIYNDCANAKNN